VQKRFCAIKSSYLPKFKNQFLYLLNFHSPKILTQFITYIYPYYKSLTLSKLMEQLFMLLNYLQTLPPGLLDRLSSYLQRKDLKKRNIY
jgi:hypothetical protein